MLLRTVSALLASAAAITAALSPDPQTPQYSNPDLSRRDEAFQPLITADFPHSLGTERLHSWMEPKADPCYDFYTYSCGGFQKKYGKMEKADVLELMQESNSLLMQQILNQTSDVLAKSSEDKALFDKTRAYYDSCLDVSTVQSRGFSPIIPLAKKVVSRAQSGMSLPALFAELHKDGIYALFKTAYTKVENGDPKDLRLQFFPSPAYMVSKATVKSVLKAFLDHECFALPSDLTLDDISEWVYGLEKEGIHFVKNLNEGHKQGDGLYSDQFVTLPQLNAKTQLDWTQYTNALNLTGVNEIYFWGNAETWTNAMLSFVKFKPQHLQYFFLWRLGVSHFNKLSQEYWQLWAGQIYPKAVRSTYEDANDQNDVFQNECITELGVHLNYLTGHLFVKYAFNETQKDAATDLVNHLIESFRYKITNLGWMDPPTKSAALAKLDNMVKVVGYPDWLIDTTKVSQYHSSLTFNPATYFENAVAAQIFSDLTPSQHQLRAGAFERTNLYFGYPWQLNAFHLTDYVQIQINPGILQRPLFSALNADAMNYGSLGTIIGHEITHAFDSMGYKLDKDGIKRPWWTERSTELFAMGSKCFEDQYSQYRVMFRDGSVGKVDGTATLAENIADNGGMDVALTAWLHKIGGWEVAKQKAPGYGGLTWEQVFFVSFGQTWCSAKGDKDVKYLLENDVHAPNAVRVRGVLHNSPEFAGAFGCPVGSAMNPLGDEGRCYLY
ncbi:Endothelin-converting enzyme 2 [Rhizophlyctis rosea]|nr:Endothelin-converting enzyme 2 [Rhizophlyctis rosea]